MGEATRRQVTAVRTADLAVVRGQRGDDERIAALIRSEPTRILDFLDPAPELPVRPQDTATVPTAR
ncbi:MAG: hypothetical protein U0736_00450 [Gemmataceae bacterium]